MINENQKKMLKKTIKNMIYEMIEENGFYESDDNTNKSNDKNIKQMREEVMQWLSNDHVKNSEIAYDLWPDMDEDEARSLFSKKALGTDSNGNQYSFEDNEIVTLFNMMTNNY